MPDPTDGLADKTRWLALATGSAVITSFAARNLVKAMWRLVKNDDPPMNPAALGTEWKEAVAWTLMTGVVAGLARLFARRGAATAWQNVTGSRPPAFNK